MTLKRRHQPVGCAGNTQESLPLDYNEGDALGSEGGRTMSVTAADLAKKHCAPCEGGIPRLSPDEVRERLTALPGWKLSADGQRIRREWRVQDFTTALDFFNRVGQVAEGEGHHPDLHLTGYRNVAIEIWTHAINGLSENDFILAAKIDTLPVALKK
jgi:4a-hydroxytetrahydrobiopterin dehydratase